LHRKRYTADHSLRGLRCDRVGLPLGRRNRQAL
jgi:hypothetical protein